MKELLIYHQLSERCVSATTTTLLGNLAYQVDEGKGVKERREQLANLLSLPIARFTFVHQHHSDQVSYVSLKEMGRGQDSFEDGLECDALYTYEKEIPLCIFHADCVPVFFINERASLVGIIHAGFKGTMKHVTYKVMKEIVEKEQLDIKDFKFYIGPFRQPQSFIVDEVTRQTVLDAGFSEAIKSNQFDNGLANVLDLLNVGADKAQIQITDLDTVSDERLYSAYQKTPVGRLVSLIYLK